MCIEINRKVAFLILHSRTKKSKYCCHPPFHPPYFCCHFSKLLSPILPKLMNWILLSPPPLSSDPDNPPKFGTCTYLQVNTGVINIINSNTAKCLVTQYCYTSLQVKTNVSYAGNLVCQNILSHINTLFKVEKSIKCHPLPT